MATKPKTFSIMLKDGTRGRAVRVTARNNKTVLGWVVNGEYREQVSKSGQATNQRIMVPVNTTKQVRAAYYEDWIVKTDKGFQVVKFDKVEESLFFVATSEGPEMNHLLFEDWKGRVS